MVEDDEAVVKTGVAVGQFQIIHRAAREFWLGKIFQVVAPVTKRAAERKRQVNFVEQFKTRHERVEDVPRVAELKLRAGGSDFAARAEGAKGEKRIRRDKGIARRRQIELRRAQQHDAIRLRFATARQAEIFDKRFRRVRGLDFLNQRAHLKITQTPWA